MSSIKGVADNYKTNIRNMVNNLSKWVKSSHGFYPNTIPSWSLAARSWTPVAEVTGRGYYPGYPYYGYYYTYDYNSTANYLEASSTQATDIDNRGTVSAPTALTALINSMRVSTQQLSNVRKLNMVKYYNDGVNYGGYYAWSNTTVYAAMTEGYALSLSSIPSAAANSVESMNNYANTLYNTLVNHIDSTVGFTEHYCHTSCHGSRTRR